MGDENLQDSYSADAIKGGDMARKIERNVPS
jgi:hypothetical protein